MANYGKLITSISTGTANSLILGAGVVYVDYGEVTERCLGATEGGNSFKQTEVIREIPLDNKFGTNYKGLKRIVSRDAELTINLKEITATNLKDVVLGSTVTGTVKSYAVEYAGIGTTATSGETFTLLHKPIRPSMLVFLNGIRHTSLEDSTSMMSASSTGTSMKIIGQGRVTSTEEVAVGYYYWTTSTDTYTSIYSKGVIQTTDYNTNVCLVAPLSGSTKLVQCYLYNAISDGGFDAKLSDKDELVVPVTFRAHWTATMGSTEYISKIKYPK
jgi:hypothetical protein